MGCGLSIQCGCPHYKDGQCQRIQFFIASGSRYSCSQHLLGKDSAYESLGYIAPPKKEKYKFALSMSSCGKESFYFTLIIAKCIRAEKYKNMFAFIRYVHFHEFVSMKCTPYHEMIWHSCILFWFLYAPCLYILYASTLCKKNGRKRAGKCSFTTFPIHTSAYYWE